MKRTTRTVVVAVAAATVLCSTMMTVVGSPAEGGTLRSAASGRALGATAGFACTGGFTGGSRNVGGPEGPRVTAVRVGRHGVYDRFVIQFSGAAMPRYRVTRHSTTFPLEIGSVTLAGTHGVLVWLFPVNAFSYHGPQRIRPRFPVLRVARMVEYFEGYMQWGLGIRGRPCLRVAVFTSPTRLVVDVARP